MKILKTTKFCDSGVYSITNKCNGKIYVGSSVKIKQRWRGHISDLNKNKHKNIHLQRSWNKYGSDNFSFDIIGNCHPDQVLKLEQINIDKLNVCDVRYGYNISPKAQNCLGIKRRPETILKIREAKLKNPIRYWKDKKLSDDHKRKIGIASIGRNLNKSKGSVEFLKPSNKISSKNRFRTRLKHDKKRWNLGCFKTKEEARSFLDNICRLREKLDSIKFNEVLGKLMTLNKDKKTNRYEDYKNSIISKTF